VRGRPETGAVDSEAHSDGGWGGRAEGLRRRRGEAAGAQLGAHPGRSACRERGNHPKPPWSPDSRSGCPGQVRRRPRAAGGAEAP